MKKFYFKYENIIHVIVFLASLVILSWFVSQESIAQEPIGVETEYWYYVADSLRQVIEEQNHNIANIPLRPTQYEAFCIAIAPWALGATIILLWLIVLIYRFRRVPDLKNMFKNILCLFGGSKF